MKRLLIGSLAASLLLLCISIFIFAQVNRPYRNGSVWSISLIRTKPGMNAAYLTYVATDWKKEQEEVKKEGLILSYKVLTTTSTYDADGWNLMLMTEYKDLATYEATAAKREAVVQRATGNDQKQMQSYKEREEIREMMGIRLAREMVLEAGR